MKTLYINGVIGLDFTPKTIVDFLAKTNGTEPIAIVLNTPGGLVIEGFEIRNILNDYKGAKTIVLNAFVASMGSYIAMLPSAKVVARDNTVFMIHNVWGLAVGDYRSLRHTSNIYEAMTNIIALSICEKTKKKKEETRSLMDAETWYYSDELLKEGFVDEIVPSGQPIEGIEYSNDAEKNIFFFMDSANKSERINKSKLDCEVVKKYTRITEFSIDKAAAICGNSIEIVQGKKPDIILQEAEKIMNLKEFLDSNPQARKEYDEEINKNVSEALAKERKNVSELIDISGLTCNSGATQELDALKNAVAQGVPCGNYAIALVKKQQDLRTAQVTNLGALQNVNPANFNGANGTQKQAQAQDKGEVTALDTAVDEYLKTQTKKGAK